MYTKFDVIGDAEERANAIVAARDRSKYIKFIVAALRYIAASTSAIVGGDAATRLLINGSIGPDVTQYTIYAENGVATARGIADAMYSTDRDGLGHYAAVITAIADYKFVISVDGRDMFTVIQLPKSSVKYSSRDDTDGSTRSAVPLAPAIRSIPFAEIDHIRCIGADLRLIEIYASLCDPRTAKTWAADIAVERRLRELFLAGVRGMIANATGGAVSVGGSSPRAAGMRRTLRDRYAPVPGRVLIGAAAIAIASGQRVANQEDRLQVVTSGTLDAESAEIIELLGTAGLSAHVDNPNLAVEPRLRRLTIHLEVNGRREALIDVYNSAAYEAVPWQSASRRGGGRRPRDTRRRGADRDAAAITADPPASLRLGTPYALMRYRLIDFWIIQLLLNNRVIGAEFAKQAMLGILSGYVAAAELCDRQLAACAADSPESVGLLPAANYVGRIEDCAIALRRKAMSSIRRQFYPTYFSAASGK